MAINKRIIIFSCFVTCFQMWQFAPNSLHYLLSLWQRMVASMPYVKNTEPHLLETYAPEVTCLNDEFSSSCYRQLTLKFCIFHKLLQNRPVQ